MKPNTITKTLACSVFTIFLLSLGACQIKSLGVQISDEPEPVVFAKSKPKGGPPPQPLLMVTVPNIPIATIPRATYISMFLESATST
jgi:hypothetical protein